MTKKNPNSTSSDKSHSEFIEHYRVPYIKEICRELRKHSTKSEELLWKALRNRKLAGLKFYRQHPFGRSVVDFYCHEKRLVVEVDGGIHKKEDVREYDRIRQELIELRGVRFFRCTTDDIENDMEGVLIGILKAANSPLNSLSLKRGDFTK